MNLLISLHAKATDRYSVQSHDGSDGFVPCEWVRLDEKLSVHCDTPETADRIARAFVELADQMRSKAATRGQEVAEVAG